MKSNILSLFLGLGLWGGLLVSPTIMHAQEDMSSYDIDLDLTYDDISYSYSQSQFNNYTVLSFNNEDYSFIDTTGCITGDTYVHAVAQGSYIAKAQIPIKVTGHNVLPGTYDVYVVMVPHYYQQGVAPSDETAEVLKNKISVDFVHNFNSVTGKADSTTRGGYRTYDGAKVDTILVLENVEIPYCSYESYKSIYPLVTITACANRREIDRNGYTNELCVDRVILKAKSVTPGETLFEGKHGENITYRLDALTGTMTFSGSGTLSGFPEIDGYQTSEIGTVVVEEGITSIEERCVPDGAAVNVSLPNGLKHIGDNAFADSPVRSLMVPASVESIGDSAFYASGITSITFMGNALKSIGDYAFAETEIKQIEIPEGVKSIGAFAFTCQERDPYDDEDTYYGDEQLESIKLPNSLESIGNRAFCNSALEEITLPSGIKTLGYALFDNTPLHKVWWDVRELESDIASADPFLFCRNQIDTFYIGGNAVHLPDSLCYNTAARGRIEIPNGVQTIGAYCFYNTYPGIGEIPASVKSIGKCAYGNSYRVSAENTVYCDVDGSLFNKDKTELLYFCPNTGPYPELFCRIPDGVQKVSDWAFYNYGGLINVHVPASVNSMSLDAFKHIRNLTTEWKTAEELPVLFSSTLEAYPFTVQVPHGSKEVYQQADGWKNCTIVNEIYVGNALVGKPTFSIFQQMMEATGYNKLLMAFEDEEFKKIFPEDADNFSTVSSSSLPYERYYGFTVLAERNTVFETLLGKNASAISLRDLTNYLATHYEGKTDEDYTSEDHVLNRFVSYHLLPVSLPKEKLVIHYNEKGYDYNNPGDTYTIPVMVYYETLGKGRRLLKMSESAISNGVRINRFMKTDRETGLEIASSGAEGIAVNREDSDNASYLNGYMYALDELLVYSPEVCRQMGSERMRHDMAALMPELANNAWYFAREDLNISVPNNYPYFKNLSISKNTFCAYLPGYKQGWNNYQGDELNVSGEADITITLPAVPVTGTYELRLGTNTVSTYRGIAQAYVGTDKENLPPCGLPIDFRAGRLDGASCYDVGWVQDTGDKVVDQLDDLRMREKGYLKGIKGYYAIPGTQESFRDQSSVLRRIIGQFHMEAGETYYLRFKSCINYLLRRELCLDFIELVPQNVYDNPNEPEDQW